MKQGWKGGGGGGGAWATLCKSEIQVLSHKSKISGHASENSEYKSNGCEWNGIICLEMYVLESCRLRYDCIFLCDAQIFSPF
jgi:hypothetical protein